MKLRRSRVLWSLVLGCPLFAVAARINTVRWMETRRVEKGTTYRFPTRELAELDCVLQARFAVVPDRDFGMGRIGPRHEIFRPVSAAERDAISALRAKKQEVVFYVAGRNYLQHWPTAGAYEAPLQGPIYMTGTQPLKVNAQQEIRHFSWGGAWPQQPKFQTQSRPKDLPSESLLRVPLDRMLVSNSRFDHTSTPDGTTFRAGNWQVVAVPVRATDQACVNCHRYLSMRNPPRLGDPLGIALYATRPSH